MDTRKVRRQIGADEFFYVLQDDYDEHIELAIPFYKLMHAELIRCLPPAVGGLRVLDLGAGTGKTAGAILASRPNVTVTAIDLFESMMTHARARLVRFSDQVGYVVGDFMEVDLGRDYDVCVSSLAIHHQTAEGKKELFGRVYRALKSTGRFVIIDWTKFGSALLQELAAETAARHAEQAVPKAEIAQAWIRHWKEKNIPDSVEDLCAWLRDAGFSGAECVIRFYGIALICAEKAR